MEYMLLIYTSEAENRKRTEAQSGEVLKEYGAFTQWVRSGGKLKSSNALDGTPTATTVRVREGRTLTTDGPFAETKEQLGGYYLVEAKDLDEAIAIAAKIPGARFGCVEVRPVIKFDM